MKLTKERENKYKKQILDVISKNKESMWTVHIANKINRDDECVKKLLEQLNRENKVVEIKESKFGKYSNRRRWILAEKEHLK